MALNEISGRVYRVGGNGNSSKSLLFQAYHIQVSNLSFIPVTYNRSYIFADDASMQLLPERVSETMAFSHCLAYIEGHRFLLVEKKKVKSSRK